MGYLGNKPADSYLTLEKQTFTTSATDTYTLDRAVSSVNDIELFLNNVRQEPTEAYTISGTTLTLASAITASDSMYCIYQGRAVGTQSPATGSVTNAMLENSSITLNGSAVSLGGSATVGGNNTPAFLVYNVGTQTIPSAVNTKLTFNTELYDTDNAVSSSTFTVPSGEGGKYFLAGGFRINGGGTGTYAQIHFYVNGSVVFHRVGRLVGNYNQTFDSAITYTLSAGDTVELYTKQNFGSDISYSSESAEKRQYFTGFKLIGA